MGGISRRALLAGAVALSGLPRARAADGAGSLRNARILLGDGTELTGGVRWDGAGIREVGAGVTEGEDLGGAVLFPGFYEAGSPLGLYEIDLEEDTHDEQEGSDAITPQARVIDGYNPRSELIPVARRGGVLGALVIPGGAGLVSGQAAWMRTHGDTVGDALIAAPAGIVMNLGHAGTGLPNGPTSRMGAAMKLRDLFDANEPPEPDKKKKKNKKKDGKPEEPTRAEAAIRSLRARGTKAIFAADRASDILVAIDLAGEFHLDAVLLGCAEGHLVADRIAKSALPVLLGPVTVQPDSFDTLHARYDNAAILHRHGVMFALREGGPHNARDLATEAAVAVANGLPWEIALAATTGRAPAIWGLPVGQIRPTFEASFALADGDPLQPRTRVTRAWMRGAEVSLRSRQSDLYDRFRVLK